MKKTNALRLLDAAKVAYTAREYDISDGEISGVAVAQKLGQSPDCVFKTLVAQGKQTGLNVFVIPSNAELDLKKAAQAAGDKSMEMIKSRDLEPQTGYVHGGCSPIGMKKALPTFLNESAILFDSLYVSGGKVGLQICLARADLQDMTGAALWDLTKD